MKPILPRAFRKLPILIKRQMLAALFDFPLDDEKEELLELADVMVESAVGYAHIPMGVATGFIIDGEKFDIPMATEEPSIIAAASYVATIIAGNGGISTWADEPIMGGQVFLEGVSSAGIAALNDNRTEIEKELRSFCASLASRGGGLSGTAIRYLPESTVLCFEFEVDVRDVMGANVLNRAAERISPLLERLSGGRKLMAILTNAAERRRAGARFVLPIRNLRQRSIRGDEIARRIVMASRVASEDPRRAVTHNKGILNGMSAVALATGNDTRGLEAAAHAYAASSGRYRGLTEYGIDEQDSGRVLVGRLQIPSPFGTIGGAVGLHPMSKAAIRILGVQSSQQLSRIAVAVGLAQNFAALLALVTEGIQYGHMRFHAMRLAWKAGARGAEVLKVAQKISRESLITLENACHSLAMLRGTSISSDHSTH